MDVVVDTSVWDPDILSTFDLGVTVKSEKAKGWQCKGY
jgi:hypothetical protein